LSPFGARFASVEGEVYRVLTTKKITPMKQTTLCLLSMLGGAAIGSAVALAFAPKTGKEMRGMVRDFLNEEISKWGAEKGECSAACGCEEK
jgi:hypothetical protein